MLQYLKRKEIDDQKWNQCIAGAANGMVYATTHYLDHMAAHWDAIILDDYQAIMPLPFKKKYGICYVNMPAFVQQLGIFYGSQMTRNTEEEFINLACRKFRFGDYHFNYAHTDAGLQPRNNFVLSLQEPYADLKSRYKQDLLKNLARAQKFQIQYRAHAERDRSIQLYRSLYQQRQPSVTPQDYKRFEKLCSHLEQKNQLVVRGVYDQVELLATAICVKDDKRLYLLLSATTENGRSREANHLLIDCIIHEFAGNDLIFDFEGSDVPGIAHFYKNFGTTNESYFYHHWNRLPWPVRLFKR